MTQPASKDPAGFQAFRHSPLERERVEGLMGMIPERGARALDVGARDGFLSVQLTSRFTEVTALDLSRPDISHPGVTCVESDASAMPFEDGRFDLVLCSEVLEHIPSPVLERACAEIVRVARKWVLIGVPFQQDIRLGRTTCRACGARNPPYGHVNVMGRERLLALFPALRPEKIAYVGNSQRKTNALSAALLDFAGNPYGTYDQEEGCLSCGTRLDKPPERSLAGKVATRLAYTLYHCQEKVTRPYANWIHILFRK